MESTPASRRLGAVCVYLGRKTDEGWEYLLLRRVPRFGGFWQGVTGGVDGSEIPLQAAEREVLEETGFSPASFLPINFDSLVKPVFLRKFQRFSTSERPYVGSIRNRDCILYPGAGTFVLIRPAQTFYERINFPFVFPIPDELRHLYDPRFKEFISHRFVAEVESGEPKLSFEHDAWRWCGLDEATSLLRYQNDAEAPCQFATPGRVTTE